MSPFLTGNWRPVKLAVGQQWLLRDSRVVEITGLRGRGRCRTIYFRQILPEDIRAHELADDTNERWAWFQANVLKEVDRR